MQEFILQLVNPNLKIRSSFENLPNNASDYKFLEEVQDLQENTAGGQYQKFNNISQNLLFTLSASTQLSCPPNLLNVTTFSSNYLQVFH